MRILITGGEGQLGRALSRALPHHDVTALGRAALDVSEEAAVDEAFQRYAPEAVVHSAALTDTARCEREPALAEAVNARGPELVARACTRTGARLISVSTNEVFPGSNHDYVESDQTEAVNEYGRSKASGEQRALAASPGALIVRTAWLYGDGATFPSKVLAAAADGRPLRFVSDEFATPTYCDDLAVGIAALLDRDAPPGVYHLTNSGAASRYEWACEILRLAGGDRQVEATTTAELRAGGYDGPRKPSRSVLANTKAAALGITLRPWQDALNAWWTHARVAANG